MKIGLVHNEYGVHSGEETLFYRIGDLLRQRGHQIRLFTRSSREIGESLPGKVQAFFSGIYSFQSRRQIRAFVREFEPDLVQIQNLYPLISPSILPEIARCGIPIVMRCANYRLLCPNGLLLRNGELCRRCLGGKEWWCALTNCQNNLPKSVGYALRNYAARCGGWFQKWVTRFYTQTHFQKELLVENGFDEKKIDVIPNMIRHQKTEFAPGDYVAYLGRVSREKGIRTLLEAAEHLPDIPFKIAGSVSMSEFRPDVLPDNVEYVGFIEKEQKEQFIRRAAMMVVPSVCYEGLPSSILEAMNGMTPVICSSIGGLGETVKHGQTGLCFQPGNSRDLSDQIRLLWESIPARQRLTESASAHLLARHSEDLYYKRLMDLYQGALDECRFRSESKKYFLTPNAGTSYDAEGVRPSKLQFVSFGKNEVPDRNITL